MLAAHPQEWPPPAGRIARLLWRARYGFRVKPLANTRLEALRVLAACLHSGRDHEWLVSAEALFLCAGWYPGDIPRVRAAVHHLRRDFAQPCSNFASVR